MPKLFHLQMLAAQGRRVLGGRRRVRRALPGGAPGLGHRRDGHLAGEPARIRRALRSRPNTRSWTGAPSMPRSATPSRVIERMVVRLSLADRVLISTPMWNFSIPYKLKQWIDLISQPGLTFRFDPAIGYIPLLKDRPTLVILACGSDFVTGMNRGRIDMASALSARGAALHRHSRHALRPDRADDRPEGADRGGARARAPAPGRDGGDVLTGRRAHPLARGVKRIICNSRRGHSWEAAALQLNEVSDGDHSRSRIGSAAGDEEACAQHRQG